MGRTNDEPQPPNVKGRTPLPPKMSTTSQKPVRPPIPQEPPPQENPKSQSTPQVRLSFGNGNKDCGIFEDSFNISAPLDTGEGARQNHPGRTATLREKVDAKFGESNSNCAKFKSSFQTEFTSANAEPRGGPGRGRNGPLRTGATIPPGNTRR